MTDQHRATPEQWAKCEQDARLWFGAFNCILELRDRIEALELGQRVTDAYIVTAATFSSEERKELGVISAPEFKAAMARAARQGAENTMAQIRTGAPVVKEFDKGFEPPTNCKQRLQRIGMPCPPKGGCDACGDMSPKWRECDAALDRLIIAEARPAGLVEQLAVLISTATTSRGAAEDVLRQVAAFLEATQGDWCASAAEVVAELVAELRQEADR
jgi:hypothetical protein